MKVPDIFVPEKNLEGNIEKLMKKPQEPIVALPEYGKFEVISANIYAEGIAKLKEQRKKPFTFAENIEARITDYETNENAELFKIWLDSVTGIAYKAKSTKFKLILRCSKLENIKSDFKQSFIPIDYDTEQGIELDRKEDKYNQMLTREEAKNHQFWAAAMNGNKKMLVRYVDLLFDKIGKDKSMGVYLKNNTDRDELYGLALDSYYYNSTTSGGNSLNYFGRFVSEVK